MWDLSKESPVFQPRPGETLRCWACEAKVGWYFVHHIGRLHSAPCTGVACCFCERDGRSFRTGWEGYLACVLAERPQARVVLRLPGYLWNNSADLQQPLDFTDGEWVYWRRPGPGAAQLSIQWDTASLGWPGEIPEGFNHWLSCLAWWILPDQAPDYRLRVYSEITPRVAPLANAELIQGWEGVRL